MDQQFPDITGTFSAVTGGIRYLMPEIALVAAFLLGVIIDLFFSRRFRHAVLICAAAGLGAAAWLTLAAGDDLPADPLFYGMIFSSVFSNVFKLVFYGVALLFLVLCFFNRQLQQHAKGTGDLYNILLVVVLGMSFMSMSINLLMVYLSVEMVSVGSYLMVGYISGNSRQAEASIKYALFGGACSAIMLYGISLIYAFTGTLDLGEIMVRGLENVPSLSSATAITLVLAGIGFKLSFVPVHFWSPDVYEGAPTPVTAFLSTGPKIAGFALLLIFLMTFFVAAEGHRFFDFKNTISVIAIMTMVVGNFSAVWQDNIKRMLAYSSIGHTGFILMGFVSLDHGGFRAMFFYVIVYALMNMAAFMLADYVEQRANAVTATGYAGLGKRFPLAFTIFVVVLISLTGIPPTGGFIGKLLIFSSVWGQYRATHALLPLAMLITGAVTTVISLFYYLKIPLNAWLRSGDTAVTITTKNGLLVYTAFAIMLILLAVGIFPQLITAYLPG
ncbi:NADH-quinone oxidoreductase subunit N [Hufsiella ginkgonis]|uniref:NADH-quinone oxidoreductase subunit N n=1 Tax=Hufsiella ginkgonis TaxID=2695274 RepID=A0A7K1Y4Y2_9SPHI|nr:NADH-quinone oxidoreductase subunit N [Hufsiella ginkgonis]MXV17776.1 NADH-quinone oxidoreductase subunit N [Hufsiella ginkgonis]